MSDEAEQYDDVSFYDDMSLTLVRAKALADLLANFRPGHDCSNGTVQNTGYMLWDIVSDLQNNLKKWDGARKSDSQ